ncbi:MAG: tetratricopeptide repeat protein [Acidobacteriaceae bacterium]
MDYARGLLFALLCTVCVSQPSFAQKTQPLPAAEKPTTAQPAKANLKPSDWKRLIQSQKCRQARALCTPYVHAPKTADKLAAQECLANVALCGADAVNMERGKNGSSYLMSSFIPAAVDESLAHINTAIKLAPRDIQVYEGKLQILEMAGRYKDMAQTLDQSCMIFNSKNDLETWLNFPVELAQKGDPQAAIALNKVLYKHYPHSSDVVGNMGVFSLYAGKPADAIPYFSKAVKLAPNDPINTWDLARAYDFTNQKQLANHWYQKGLALQKGKPTYKASSCIYGHFVGKKLEDKTRACQIETTNCAAKDRTDCPKPVKSTTSKKN